MNLEDFAKGATWAIIPDRFDDIARQLAGMHGGANLIEQAASFAQRQPAQRDYGLQNGVAVIPVRGTITKNAGFLSYLFGGRSLAGLQKMIGDALDDYDVEAIVLDFDSPGGTVAGISEAADYIARANRQKPVVASGSMIASAAYWLAAAAARVVVDAGAVVGSIGILTVHADFSKMDERFGVKYTYLTAGKYKAIANDSEPLSDEARAYLQQRLDYYYGLFVDSVANHRGMDSDAVLKAADGRIWIGAQAVDAGLADQVGGLADAVKLASQLADGRSTNHGGATAIASQGKGERTMKIESVEDLRAAFPALVEKIEATARNTAETTTKDQVEAAEKRILDLAAAHFGDDAGKAFRAVVEQGITAEQYTAISGLVGGKSEAKQPDASAALDALKKTGAKDVGDDTVDTGDKGFDQLVAEHMAANKTSKSKAMQAVRKDHPDAYGKWIADQQKR